MKKIFKTLFLIGFILALGTAGTSDLELETHQQIISDKQFYTQIAVSLGLWSIGGIGILVVSNKQDKERIRRYGTLYLQEVSNNATTWNTYHTRTKTTHVKTQERSAS